MVEGYFVLRLHEDELKLSIWQARELQVSHWRAMLMTEHNIYGTDRTYSLYIVLIHKLLIRRGLEWH
jgi:hypothetical protein